MAISLPAPPFILSPSKDIPSPLMGEGWGEGDNFPCHLYVVYASQMGQSVEAGARGASSVIG